jgi:hypothetical protein
LPGARSLFRFLFLFRHPNIPDPGYTPGPNYVGPPSGAQGASDLSGAGYAGDIDRPDLTGRGTTDDLLRHGMPTAPPQTPPAPEASVTREKHHGGQ